MYRKFIKPFIDICLALIALLINLPIILLLLILIPIFIGGNPIYIAPRGGKGGTVFNMFKFKSMNEKKDENGVLLPDDKRITKFGALIRKLSLDELPQFFNILKGDMSFIGPRPFHASYLPIYNEHQRRRHEVKPGITGWAQTHGRNALSWNEKFELDIWYIDHLNPKIDLKILFLTFLKVLKYKDINKEGYISSTLFTGNN